jgi:PKHD-type hydroxylase
MIVTEPWWVFPDLIDAPTCERLIAHGLGLDQEDGVVRKGAVGQQRKTSISWMREDWVYDLVQPWVNRANKQANWNFDVERMQSLQFGVYADGGHYDWHFDMSGRVYGENDAVAPEFHGLLRKLSFSLMLNEGTEYEGGDLELELGLPTDDVRIEMPNKERKRGTMVVFPSFVPHRVTPVTSGVRYSLVGWSCGKPWR